MSTVFCTNCGKEIPHTASFCPKCGAKAEPGEEAEPLAADVPNAPAAEAVAQMPAKAPSSKKMIAIIAALLVVIAVDIAVIVAMQLGAQKGAERASGQLPDIPAVMAEAPGWSSDEYKKKLHLGEDGEGLDDWGDSFVLDRTLRGASVGFFSAFDDPFEIQLEIYPLESSLFESPIDDYGHHSDELRVKAGKYLVLYSPDGKRELASSANGAKVFEQAVYDNSFPNREMLDFGRADAEELLSRTGIQEYEVLGEYYGEKSLVTAFDELSKSDGKRPVNAGTAYVMQVKTKDARGNDIYVDLRVGNYLDVARCISIDDELDIEQSQRVSITAWPSRNLLDECLERGFTEVSRPGELVEVTKDYPESFSSAGAAASSGSSQAAGASSAKKGDYILPDSDTKTYGKSELDKLSTRDLFLARNEIYARHGRGFQNQELRDYFGSKSWYRETVSPADFQDSMLNSVERANANAMIEIEKGRNSPYLN